MGELALLLIDILCESLQSLCIGLQISARSKAVICTKKNLRSGISTKDSSNFAEDCLCVFAVTRVIKLTEQAAEKKQAAALRLPHRAAADRLCQDCQPHGLCPHFTLTLIRNSNPSNLLGVPVN